MSHIHTHPFRVQRHTYIRLSAAARISDSQRRDVFAPEWVCVAWLSILGARLIWLVDAGAIRDTR